MSKEKILENIRKHKTGFSPEEVNYEIPLFVQQDLDTVEAFRQSVETGAGKVKLLSETGNLEDFIKKEFPTAKSIASPLENVPSNIDLKSIEDPAELKSVDVAIISGQLGVAENGAVWVTEKDCVHRVLPFITQHLIVVLDKNTVVQNMHEAYKKIKVGETGFGLFIAGPSKTADIEQSLVIGAQGARSFTVVLK